MTRDYSLVLLGLVVATALAWAWIVPLSLDMYGPMSGLSAWMMTAEWDARHLGLLAAMWAVMMAAMMLPSAAPAILLYVATVRRSVSAGAVRRAFAFTSGYLVIWILFAVAAAWLQRLLAEAFLLSPMMEPAVWWMPAAVLVLAGVYQLTPFKLRCLTECQSPAVFIARRWREGTSGALRMGLTHGLYCLGCCWALMLLLFAGGVMHLPTIVGLAALVLLEKVLPLDRHGTIWFSRLTGTALIGLALRQLVSQ
jgi:predicted metal-binding membrane protein